MLAAEPEIALDSYALSKPPVAAHLPDLSSVNTIDQFAALAIGRADLSRAASRVAVEEALRADVKEFAGRELDGGGDTRHSARRPGDTPASDGRGTLGRTRADHQRPGRPRLRYRLHGRRSTRTTRT